MATSKTADAPVAFEVLESFTTQVDGVTVAYRKGEPIEPDDPIVRRNPAAFGPLRFPHPVKRRAVAPVEVRS